MTESPLSQLDMRMRLAADRVLRAIAHHTAPPRQAKVALMASAALSIATTVEPSLPNDLIVLGRLLNVGAISSLLGDVADNKEPSDPAIAARMEALLPLDRLDELATGQRDLLRALTRQHAWQQQMLRLQEADTTAGATLLAAFGEATGDLAAIREQLAGAATAEQIDRLYRMITIDVLPRLSPSVRAKYNLSGDFRGSQNFFDSTVNVAWSPPPPYNPPSPPPPDELPDPGPLPPGSYVPYVRSERFTGRGAQLLALAALLSPAPSPAGRGLGRGESTAAEEPSPNPSQWAGDQATPLVTISSGIGGVGKTALAVEFAYRYGRFFHGVHWLPAENPAAIDSAIATCGLHMGLHPTFGALPLPQQVALVERAWAGPEARLIIFDNLEDEALLARRPKGGGARLLATSRRERWDDPAARVRRLGPLSAPEGVRLLHRHLTAGEGRPARTDVAAGEMQAIAAALGELPLALRLAGAYLRRYRRESAAAYLAAVQRPDLLAHRSLDPGPGERGVAASFALSFDRLRPAADATDALALALLARAACFAPGEPLPVELLLATLEAADDEPTTDDRPPTDEPPDAAPPATPSSPGPWPLEPGPFPEDALERLLELGLLEDVDDSGDRVRLHRLLAVFVVGEIGRWEKESSRQGAKGREGAKEEGKGVMAAAREAVEKAVISLAHRQNTAGDPRALRMWDAQLRHVVDAAFEREDETAATLSTNFGYYLRMSGDLAGARPYYERALAIFERVLGPEHPDTAASLNNLGQLLQDLGDLTGARAYLKRALTICERVLGPEHSATAASLNNLGLLLQAQGDLVGARPYYERALAISERVLGPEHPDTAASLNNLGRLLKDQGDLAGARPYYERALAIKEHVLGPEHPATALSLNNLGRMLQALGDLAGARPYLERALAIFERVLGPEHPQTAQSLNNLGLLLQDLGDLAGARPYYERALAILTTRLGPDHPNTRIVRDNLATLPPRIEHG